MLTTLKLLEMVKKANGNCSDYRAAKLIGVSRGTVSAWQHRRSVMDDESTIKTAILLDLDPEYVLACIQAERSKGSVSHSLWQHICERLEPRKLAASFALFLAVYTVAQNNLFI